MNGKAHPPKEVYSKARQSVARSGSTNVIMRRPSADCSALQCDAAELLHFVQVVARNGDLCSFTQTSDGGAICVCILQGASTFKSYARTADEFLVRLSDLLDHLY